MTPVLDFKYDLPAVMVKEKVDYCTVLKDSVLKGGTVVRQTDFVVIFGHCVHVYDTNPVCTVLVRYKTFSYGEDQVFVGSHSN